MTINNKLIGCWEQSNNSSNDKTQIEFYLDGNLVYTISTPIKDQMFFLKYIVEDNIIISDQPSAPKEVRTLWYVTHENKLILSTDGHVEIYSRADTQKKNYQHYNEEIKNK